MVVLRVSFNGLLHKTLGERIGVVPWSEPPAESLRIPWKRVKWTVTGVKDVYKKEDGQSTTVSPLLIQPTNVHEYFTRRKRDAFRRLRDKFVSDSRTGLELVYFEVGK